MQAGTLGTRTVKRTRGEVFGVAYRYSAIVVHFRVPILNEELWADVCRAGGALPIAVKAAFGAMSPQAIEEVVGGAPEDVKAYYEGSRDRSLAAGKSLREAVLDALLDAGIAHFQFFQERKESTKNMEVYHYLRFQERFADAMFDADEELSE